MPTHRLPILICEDAAGLHTAVAVEWPDLVAVAETAVEATSQLTRLAKWLTDNGRIPEPETTDAELLTVSVPVRPVYTSPSGRLHPCDDEIAIPVPTVLGRHHGGLWTCALPLLDQRAYIFERSAAKQHVTHMVQQALQGLTPQALARYLPPPLVRLDEIVVRTARRKRDPRRSDAKPPTLTHVAESLADPALRKRYSRAFGRDAVVDDLARRLDDEKVNVLLVGESGVGKTAVLIDTVRKSEVRARDRRRAAARYRNDDTGDGDDTGATGIQAWMTGAGRLVAGMKYLGQWEERVEEIVGELASIDGVLVLDGLLDAVVTGGEGPANSIAAFLGSFIAHGDLRVVAEAAPHELDAARRLLPGFCDLFQIVELPTLDRDAALDVLERVTAIAAAQHKLPVDGGVPDAVYTLFSRFRPYDAFPGPAVAFIREVVDRCARETATEDAPVRVDAAAVLREFVRQTGLPEVFLRDDLPLPVERLNRRFAAHVIGQADACRTASSLPTAFKAGMNDPQRPIGVLLLAGPTGVGKTSLARAMAQILFGGDAALPADAAAADVRPAPDGDAGTDRLIRLDMSEYSGPGAAARLLLKPGGERAEWIERVRRQPFCVVLFDEIEKAHADVFDVLLGVMDEGRLSDQFGRQTIFRSAVVLMTSNLGARAGEAAGFVTGGTAGYDDEARRFFRPEFYNRLDAVVTFAPLDESAVRSITEKELSDLARREGLHDNGIALSWTDDLVAWLSRHGYSPEYGARPLQRVLERTVVRALARYAAENPRLRDTTLHLGLRPVDELDPDDDAVASGDSDPVAAARIRITRPTP
jgi:ATP-dependent Clp protease ATP-binding subunit ClpC